MPGDGPGEFVSANAPPAGDTGFSTFREAIRAVLAILAAQLGMSALLAAIGGLVAGKTAALSGLAGGMICLLPNTFLALRIFVAGYKREPRALVRGVYAAEAGKLAITVLLFVAAFTLVKPLAAGWLFAGFIATQGVMWVALRLDKTGFKASGKMPEQRDKNGD